MTRECIGSRTGADTAGRETQFRGIEEICLKLDTLQRTGNAAERVRAARAMGAFGRFLELVRAIDQKAA